MKFVKPNDARGILYYVLVAAMFVLLIIDLVGDGTQWGNIGVLVLVAATIFVRPGGVFRTGR